MELKGTTTATTTTATTKNNKKMSFHQILISITKTH